MEEPTEINPLEELSEAELRCRKADAEQDRISPADLPAIFARHQAGDDDAARRLRDGYYYVIWERYEAFQPSRWLKKLDVLLMWHDDLETAIAQLRYSGIARDVEPRIRNQLRHSPAHYCEQQRTADKIGSFTRTETTVREVAPDEYVSLLDDPQAPLMLAWPDGTPYRVPSRYETLSPAQEAIYTEQAPLVADEMEYAARAVAAAEAREREDEYQRLIPYANTERHRQILQAKREGKSTPEIAEQVPGMTFSQIDNLFARLWRRAA